MILTGKFKAECYIDKTNHWGFMVIVADKSSYLAKLDLTLLFLV
jgi:hypothetical protein